MRCTRRRTQPQQEPARVHGGTGRRRPHRRTSCRADRCWTRRQRPRRGWCSSPSTRTPHPGAGPAGRWDAGLPGAAGGSSTRRRHGRFRHAARDRRLYNTAGSTDDTRAFAPSRSARCPAGRCAYLSRLVARRAAARRAARPLPISLTPPRRCSAVTKSSPRRARRAVPDSRARRLDAINRGDYSATYGAEHRRAARRRGARSPRARNESPRGVRALSTRTWRTSAS